MTARFVAHGYVVMLPLSGQQSERVPFMSPSIFLFFFLAILMLLGSIYHRASLIFLSVIITAVVIVVHSSNSSTYSAARRTNYQLFLRDFSTDSFFFFNFYIAL